VEHGFKTRAERLAISERTDLGLTDRCRLDPTVLAEAKGHRVVPLSVLDGVSTPARVRLQDADPAAFSAAAVLHGSNALIVVNDMTLSATRRQELQRLGR
jgi:hypothetical protein